MNQAAEGTAYCTSASPGIPGAPVSADEKVHKVTDFSANNQHFHKFLRPPPACLFHGPRPPTPHAGNRPHIQRHCRRRIPATAMSRPQRKEWVTKSRDTYLRYARKAERSPVAIPSIKVHPEDALAESAMDFSSSQAIPLGSLATTNALITCELCNFLIYKYLEMHFNRRVYEDYL